MDEQAVPGARGAKFAQVGRDVLKRVRHLYEPEGVSYILTRWVFLRLLGIVYLIAFVSLAMQIDGLVGSEGIQPVGNFLNAVTVRYPTHRFLYFPTLSWLDASDTFLHILTYGGIAAALLLILDIAVLPALAVLWAFYLSLTVDSQIFLGYQWDALLLETGFLAMFLASLLLRPRVAGMSPPSLVVIWLLRWLTFRLTFSSGAVKLLSRDASWQGLTALTYHYETQPIPNPLAWHMHQLPLWFHQWSVAAVFVLELYVPFLLLGTRKMRWVAGAISIAFQVMVMATGNFAFFNVLTIALLLLAFDDGLVRRLMPRRLAQAANAGTQERVSAGRYAIVLPVACSLLMISSLFMVGMFVRLRELPDAVVQILRLNAGFRLVNSYGLFAVMTTSRPEIIIEGSNDGQTWLAYEFRYKAGDLGRAPPWIAPFQPRLDWQMWFAALGPQESSPWFSAFMQQLLRGSPPVLGLLATNPFPDAPPRFVRALLYDYHFTNWETRNREGIWWERELLGEYFPPVTLESGPTRPRAGQ